MSYQGFSLRRSDFHGDGLKRVDHFQFMTWRLQCREIHEVHWIEGLFSDFVSSKAVILC